MYKHLLEKKVMNSRGMTLEVRGICFDRGVTLEDEEGNRTCIHGKLSSEKTCNNYPELFRYLVDSIDYGYYDTDILDSICLERVVDFGQTDGHVVCAFI